MPLLKIRYLPDPCLRQVSKPVKKFDKQLQTLIDNMFETMYHVKGVGLAAPQVGINLRLSVIDVNGDKKDQIVIINPEVIERHGVETFQEGCLSVPGSYDKVQRSSRVIIRALDRHGEEFTREADGLLGECLQHEIEHLDGKLYIDLLSPLKRKMARKKSEKHLRAQQE